MHKDRSRALLICIVLSALLIPALEAEAAPMCFGRKATIVGTDASDQLIGTSASDVMVGLEGRDHINGKGGNDFICGGDNQYGSEGVAEVLSGGRETTASPGGTVLTTFSVGPATICSWGTPDTMGCMAARALMSSKEARV